MSPLLVGMFLLVSAANADVKHVLEGSAHPPTSDVNSINADAREINYLAHSGASAGSFSGNLGGFGSTPFVGHGTFAATGNALPFWWMDPNSPFKHAYEYYKRCSLKGNCLPPVVPQSVVVPQPQNGCNQNGCAAAPKIDFGGGIDIKNNPFLNGQFQSVAVSSCSGTACKNGRPQTVVTTCEGRDCKTSQLEGSNVFVSGGSGGVVVSGGAASCGGTSCSRCGNNNCNNKDINRNPFINVGTTGGFGAQQGPCGGNKCQLIPAVNGGGQSEGFVGTIDISKNPFLNGAFAGGSVSTHTVHTSGNGATVEDNGNGFLGVQPFPPFGSDQKAKPFPTKYPDQNQNQNQQGGLPFPTAIPSQPNKKPFPTSYPGQSGFNGNPFFKPNQNSGTAGDSVGELGLACKGLGYICVSKELCQNGVVVKNGEGLLQARSDEQYCNVNTQTCCHLANAPGSANTIPSNGLTGQSFYSSQQSSGSFASSASGSYVKNQNSFSGPSDLLSVTAGKSSVPGSVIKFGGGAGLSPGLIHVLPAGSEPRPQVSFAGESGSDKHYGSSTKPTRDINSNSVFSSTVDYSDTNFGDVRFASSIKGPEYLPPLPSSPVPNRYNTPELVAPSISTYQPTIQTTFRPFVTSSPTPFVTPDFSGNQPYATTKTNNYSPSLPANRQPTTSNVYTSPAQPFVPKQPFAQPSTPKPTFQSTIFGNNQFVSSSNTPFSQSTPAPFRTTESRDYLPPNKPSISNNVNNQYYPQKPVPTPRPQRPTPSQPQRPTIPLTRPQYIPPSPTPSQPPRPTYQPSFPTTRPQYVPPSPSPKPSRPILTQPQRPSYKPTPAPATYRPQVTNRYVPPSQPQPSSFRPQTYRPTISTPTTNGREYLPPLPSSPRPNIFVPQQPSTFKPPLTSFIPQKPSTQYVPQRQTTQRPYTPTPKPFVPGVTVEYQPSSPQPTNNVNVQYVPPVVQSTPRPATSIEYLPPSPSTIRPIVTQPSTYRPITQPAPNPSIGYVYNKPTPSFSYPTTTTSQPLIPSQTNVGNQYIRPPKPTPKPNNGYLPPRPDEQSGSSVLSPNIQPQPGDSNIVNIIPYNPDNTGDSANNPNIYLQTTQRTFTGELNTTPHPGCAAALKCVQEIYCTADGVISPVPVVLTKEQELIRVPTTVCADQESGIVGKCCRDPNYQDPWPSANLVNGVDDGQYREDPSLGQYTAGTPGLQRPVRSGRQSLSTSASIQSPNVVQSLSQSQPSQPNQPTCGEVHRNGQPKGPGPIDVNFAQIPWQAMVLRDSNRSLLCGGAIIRRDAVLTTASCVEGLDTSDVLVKGGEWKLGIDEEPLPFQIVKVSVIVRHPQFKPGQFTNNMALLVLEEKLRLANNVGTICLPEPNQIPIQNCIVTGWGKRILQLHARGAIMHSIGVDIMRHDQCQSSLQLSDNANVLCGLSSKDQCLVDYGSALACSADNDHYTLSGIFSWDSGCKSNDQIGAYVAPDVAWINTCLAKPTRELKQLEKQYLAEQRA